ncbi:unnamed protein product [Bursaphelenchus xylophilus]|uniref:(pine wood nematode) hypothetical protein n=1 Tax=Bursaphelenchus xylophilus TaxID=6326 RepID=A0A1I7RL00_BURXY|nr:unnamed protein product [Bursaphelenchus xylophilus]CAG9083652.1 unnamed protein product [Bursaphelenchus xylophilus]
MGEVAEFESKLRKAFHELALKTNQTNDQLEEVRHSKNIMEQNIKVAEIAKEEVQKLDPERSVYHSIGGIFVYRKHQEEIDDQQKDIDSYKKRIEELEKQREYLQKNLTDAQKNLREMVQQSRVAKA